MVVCGDVGVNGQSLEDGALRESGLPAGVFRPLSLEASLQGRCGSVSRAREASERGCYTSVRWPSAWSPELRRGGAAEGQDLF